MKVAFSSKRRDEIKVMYEALLNSKMRIVNLSIHTNEDNRDYDYIMFNTNKFEKLYEIEKYLEQFGFIWIDEWSEIKYSYVMGIMYYGGKGWEYEYQRWKKQYEKQS